MQPGFFQCGWVQGKPLHRRLLRGSTGFTLSLETAVTKVYFSILYLLSYKTL